jgi:ubiquitin-protein ligase
MQVYYPNIDLDGNACLNILREDWNPVLNINTVIYGLNLLFTVFHLSWIPIDSKNVFRMENEYQHCFVATWFINVTFFCKVITSVV